MSDLKFMLQYTLELSALYVEDDEILLSTSSKLFSNYFKHLDTAIDGQDGLNKYIAYEKENNKFYDLIITDIKMPKLDGLDMSKEILKLNPLQSIVITTAHSENEFLVSAIELGITAFLPKPIESKKLNKALFKASQAISDRNFVEDHVGMIEDLNMQLEAQNQELIKKNSELEKSFRMLDTVVHKDKMMNKNTTKPTAPDVNEKDYLEQITHLVTDDLYELQEILDEIDLDVIELIRASSDITADSLQQLIENFTKYTSILQMYSFFSKLSNAMSNFSLTMKNSPLPQSKESIKNIFMLLESFIYVLGKWHQDISSEDASKINQFDNSIISDMDTITNMWTQKDEDFNENDMDDIFDF